MPFTRTNIHRLLIVGLASGFAVGPVAAAGDAGEDREKMLERADANGDGDIEWSEVVAMRKSMFKRLDRNKDGFIDTDDRPPLNFGKTFDDALPNLKAQFDADGDGRVAEAEMINAPAPLFEAGDADGDGVLSADERAALRARTPDA